MVERIRFSALARSTYNKMSDDHTDTHPSDLWTTASKDDKAALVEGALWVLQSANEIAEALGTTRNAVISAARRNNIHLPGRSGRKISPELAATIRHEAKSMSLRNVAIKLGIDRGTVRKYAKHEGPLSNEEFEAEWAGKVVDVESLLRTL